jgi:hypothetical protein
MKGTSECCFYLLNDRRFIVLCFYVSQRHCVYISYYFKYNIINTYSFFSIELCLLALILGGENGCVSSYSEIKFKITRTKGRKL